MLKRKSEKNHRREELMRWFLDNAQRKTTWDYEHRREILDNFEEIMQLGITEFQYSKIVSQHVLFPEIILIIAKYKDNVTKGR